MTVFVIAAWGVSVVALFSLPLLENLRIIRFRTLETLACVLLPVMIGLAIAAIIMINYR